MIVHGLDAPGFAAAVEQEDGGLLLQRVPEAVRGKLNERAQVQTLRPASNELRAVTDDGKLRLTLSSPNGGVVAVPFYGPFQLPQRFAVGPEKQTLELAPVGRTFELPDTVRADLLYPPEVIRLVFHGGGSVVVHGAEGAGLRPPSVGELPSRRLLTYGTSITHGAAASLPHLAYAWQLAWRLRADNLNYGVGGACQCEPAFADYMASRRDWTVAVLALSVNMIGAGFTPDAFYQRVRYLIDTVAGADPTRPVMCVSIFPHTRDLLEVDDAVKAPPEVYREKLREAVRACSHANVYFAAGPEILADIGGLSVDLVHPGDLGMIRMAENLAARLEPLL